jgi:hypothetical protein
VSPAQRRFIGIDRDHQRRTERAPVQVGHVPAVQNRTRRWS